MSFQGNYMLKAEEKENHLFLKHHSYEMHS